MQCGVFPEGDGQYEVLLYHVTTESAATVQVTPHAIVEGHYPVRQHGPRKLWEEAHKAYRWWVAHGTPGRTRYGLTITPTEQHLWLDEPTNLVCLIPSAPLSRRRRRESGADELVACKPHLPRHGESVGLAAHGVVYSTNAVTAGSWFWPTGWVVIDAAWSFGWSVATGVRPIGMSTSNTRGGCPPLRMRTWAFAVERPCPKSS
jgi:hypothetical protein